MFIRSLILIFAIFLTSCASPAEVDVDKLDPELRETAFDAYKEILGGCQNQGTEMRYNVLAEERKSLLKLEKEIEGTLADVDFALARQKYAARPNVNTWICGFGDGPTGPSDFDRDKKRAKFYISELTAEARAKNQTVELPSWLNVQNSVEFRALVEAIYWQVSGFGCGSYVFNGLVFEEEAKKLEQFEDSISGTDYAHHFIIAKADAEYESGLEVYECINPYKGKEREDAIAEGKANIMKNLDRLKEIVETKVQE